jgi:hypothetical protein
VIDALTFSVHVTFDRTGWIWRLAALVFRIFSIFPAAHRFGSGVNFSETRLEFRGKNWVPQND